MARKVRERERACITCQGKWDRLKTKWERVKSQERERERDVVPVSCSVAARHSCRTSLISVDWQRCQEIQQAQCELRSVSYAM